MATMALSRPLPPHRPVSGIESIPAAAITLDALDAIVAPPSPRPKPLPNKHIPVCPPGPVPSARPNTPPPSPGADDASDGSGADGDGCPQSLLFPPDEYIRMQSGPLSLYKIDASQVSAAIDHALRQPLPDPAHVFPWLHGLHPSNHIQLAFFVARRRGLRKTPCCLRGLTLVKADGDLTTARLRGAIAPHEFLLPGSGTRFLEVNPKDGFSVRNFQIQAAKSAMTSDIVVYGDDEVLVRKLGWDIAAAQQHWHEEHERQGHPLPAYNTFICVSPFRQFEQRFPEMVAVDSAGRLTGHVVDFAHEERTQMYEMSRASEISHNVWLGPTPEPATEEEQQYDVLIECSDVGRLNPGALQAIAQSPDDEVKQPYLEFPSSGSILPPTWSHAEADGILETCKWIHQLAHGYPAAVSDVADGAAGLDVDGDTNMDSDAAKHKAGGRTKTPGRARRILIHCADGYTESTMLGIAYFSYSTGKPLPEAWLHLHTEMGRNFFAYPTDVALLTAIAPRLLSESPAHAGRTLADITALVKDEPKWLAGLDGSFPSRVLDYMYLGNLGHANNPDLLKALGIGQILSVGETPMWREGELDAWGEENTCVVKGVQDNGIDPLTDEFDRCLDFVERGRRNGTATLVHCRVGVSRSATICIAEVMRSLNLSFPRAYCFVRARRLNVIIQPHLRFAYELLKWEEKLHVDRARSRGLAEIGINRELEWADIAREIALMNRPYAR